MYAVQPSVLPYYLIFWPGCLPSTFDLEKHIAKGHLNKVGNRVQGMLQALMDLETEANNDKVTSAQAHALRLHGLATRRPADDRLE